MATAGTGCILSRDSECLSCKNEFGVSLVDAEKMQKSDICIPENRKIHCVANEGKLKSFQSLEYINVFNLM